MKALRPILLALLLAAGFYALTTHNSQPIAPAHWLGNSGRLELTEAAAPPQLDSEETTNVNVYKKALPTVVNIKSTTVSYDFFYGAMPQEGQGSGFVLDKLGHILTNYHVIADARQVEVTLSGRKSYKAEVIGGDASLDLAVLKINAPNLAASTLGDSHDLVVGQKVFAIGNPFGLEGTMTRGIISSIRPIQHPDGSRIDEAIQTDAAINPGNSGGPLLNSRAEVIGINTMIFSPVGQSAGIGFAIPINTAKAVLNDLVTYGRVRRPTLGVELLPVGPELAEQMHLSADHGLLIMRLLPGGAAERAGLHGGDKRAYLGNTPIMLGGDLIVAIDDQNVEDTQDLQQAMNLRKAGDTVTVTVYRGQRKMQVRVVLGESRGRA
ncbi:MAG TPA: trypsin-like peptidase domain-containing protein [Terriglobales bacterium]|jgi:S1-C subfamily serine protease|nr:trypsin-like peptidase domain-containing protein [Terriglobales bacterium]